MHFDRFAPVVEIEREPFVNWYRNKRADGLAARKSEDFSKKFGRGELVVRGNDGVVEGDGHDWTPDFSFLKK
jgi:hypothetical protein